MSRETESLTSVSESVAGRCEWSTLRMITWFSAGMAVAALGIVVGSEIRSRARFKKRTPYDFYAHADEQQASEFGVGI